MDLNANFHGVPVKYWLVGASATSFLGFVLYRRHKASKAAASGGTTDTATSGATGPLPGWAGLGDALGPLGGSSPTGPLTGYTSGGVPVYGIPVDNQDKGVRVSIPEKTAPNNSPITSPVISPPLPTVSAPPQANFVVNNPATNPNVSPAAPIDLPVGALLGPATGVGQRYVSGGSEFTYG